MGSQFGLLASARKRLHSVVVLLAAAATIGECGWAATRAQVATVTELGAACAEWTTSSASLEFDDARTTVRFGAGGGRSFEISVVAWGRRGEWTSATETELTYSNDLVQLRRPSFTERFVRTDSGVRQDFVVETAPDASTSDHPLEILLALGGGMQPEVLSGARDVVLRSDDELASALYGGLRAWDATGRELPAEFALEGDRLSIRVDDGDARYPVTIDLIGERARPRSVVDDAGACYPIEVDPWIAVQEARLTASDAAGGFDAFGTSVAISGNTAVIGAMRDDHVGGQDAGSAYVFVRSGGTWTEQAKLVASDATPQDLFGETVAISGTTILVGAPFKDSALGQNTGAAYVFESNGSAWIETAKLTATDSLPIDVFGTSLAIDGDTIVIGTPFNTQQVGRSGAVYVFVRSGTGWIQQAKLTSNSSRMAESLALDGDTLAVGAPFHHDVFTQPFNAGWAHVFVRNAATWTEQAQLEAPDPTFSAEFGYSVSVDGNTLAVGADGDASLTGAVYMFERRTNGWIKTAKLRASDAAPTSRFGSAVAVDQNTLLVGASIAHHPTKSRPGAVYVFERVGSSWIERVKLFASDPINNAEFGYAADLSVDSLLVGSRSSPPEGRAYAFRLLPPDVFCFGDGSLPTACPCAPPNIVPSPSGGMESGCANSLKLDGAKLRAGGTLVPDTLQFAASIGPAYSSFAMLVRGTAASQSGVPAGDGIRCVDGTLLRFGTHLAGTFGAPTGTWTYPNDVQTTSVSVATAQPPAQTAYYQVVYRNAAPGFCSSSTINYTNGLRIVWP